MLERPGVRESGGEIESQIRKENTMSETVATSRRDLETALIEKCWKDPEFKKEVIADPKSMLESHTGQKLPPQVKIVIHEEDANTLHFSIPPAPAGVTELSDQDLEKVAGGTELWALTAATVAGGALFTATVSVAKGGW
jgi:hypothetical protein